MHIDKIAKVGYLTGNKLSSTSGTYTGDTKVTESLGITAGSKFTITTGGESKEIEITESTTINNIITDLREAGVNANFDEGNQRFYISAKNTGKDNDFTITTSNANGLDAMSKLGIASSLDDDTNTKELYTIYSNALVYNEDGTVDETATASNLQTYIDAAVAKAISDNGYAKTISDAQSVIETKTAELSTANTDFQNTYNNSTYLTTVDPDTGDTIAVTDSATIQAAINGLGTDYDAMDADTKAKYDAYTTQLTAAKSMESIQAEIDKQEAIIAEAELYYTPGVDGSEGTATQKLIDQITDEQIAMAVNSKEMLDYYANNASLTNAIRVAGQDASITLNGADYESTSNTFSINGLTISVNSTTDDDITLTTADDTNGIYDKIKSFFKEYNTLINEMDKFYNADSASDYDMLTDDDKESMSDDEIKEWEDKIKGSLLRRDSTLSTVSEAMKQIMLSGVSLSDGSKMYLNELGINTLGYFNATENEKNAYHIDGNSDDTSTSTKTDKLKSAIANDPNKVSEFFASLSKTLYTKIDDLMESTDYSSAFTVYNDKSMKKEYDDFKTKISDQEDKITNYEDFYYKKFSKMETAMAKLNSQQSSLSSLFGS